MKSRCYYDFCISQGNVATVLRCGGLNYSHSCQVIRNVAWLKLSKSAYVSQSYSENKNATVFLDTVYFTNNKKLLDKP